MIIDLLSTTNYVSYNIKIAQIIGLHEAIFLAELINLNNQQLPPKCTDSNIYFKINRKAIEFVTTFNSDEQQQLEKVLEKLGIVIFSDDHQSIKLNLSLIYNLVASADELDLKKIKRIAASKSSKSKISARQQQCNELKNLISNADIRLADLYRDWIDGVYANPKGFLSARSISIFQNAINTYAKGDFDMMRKLIEIATVNGYRDAQWAINIFEKDYANKWKKEIKQNEMRSEIRKRVELSEEVF